ncbi:receptor-type tyrosine-protein phosphatase mu-like [Amphiura filiformis]|uniref:receptor-type tyrosine-protein phosphatase mu-like n=1 Tax=Amphiura filiformis TaxID=82378 RepID=UPI003B212BD4
MFPSFVLDPQLIVSNLRVSVTENSFFVEWDSAPDPCHAIEYKVEYRLTNRDQCLELTNEPTEQLSYTSASQATISDLEYYSTYDISVTARHSRLFTEGTASSVATITEQTVPNYTPTVISSPGIYSTSLTFTWDSVPCGQIRGDGLYYQYILGKDATSITDIMDTSSLTTTFQNLTACSDYWLIVRASNNAGHGSFSEPLTKLTRAIAPGEITGLTLASVSSSELRLTWQPTSENNDCMETGYNVRYTLLNKDQCQEVEAVANNGSYSPSGTGFSSTLSGLLPYSTYVLSVIAYNEAGSGEPVIEIRTTETTSPTSHPTNITAYYISSNKISIRWSKPPCGYRNGRIHYFYMFDASDGTVAMRNSTGLEDITFDNLTPYRNYTFSVRAVTDKGDGPYFTLSLSTTEAVPSEPNTLKVDSVSKAAIKLSWSEPEHPNGIITKYTVQAVVMEKLYDPSFTHSASKPVYVTNQELDDTQRTYTFTNLKPSTKYGLTVFASSGGGNGDPASVQQFTDPVTTGDILPPPPLADINNIQKTETTATIDIPLSDSELVSGYLVGVELTSNRRKRQVGEFGHFHKSPSKYVAGELSESKVTGDSTFVVGDNQTYGSYYNPPLQEGQSYLLYTAFVSRINDTESVVSWSEPVTLQAVDTGGNGSSLVTLIVIVVLVTLLVLVAVLVIIIIRRRKRSINKRKESSKMIVLSSNDNAGNTENGDGIVMPDGDNINETTNNAYVVDVEEGTRQQDTPPSETSTEAISTQVGPITVELFEQYVLAKKESVSNSFKVDFKTLPSDNLHPWHAAKKPENKKKNRYGNITTYDNSRVTLTPLEGDPHSDFINASFIDSVYESDMYIASQGPNTESVEDFWRMIWQYKIKTVVMLTMLFESGKVKCEQYWPEEKVVLGGFNVTPNKEEKFADFVIRRFQLEQISTGEIRELRQFHFIEWPDMGVPQCPSLLNFMNVVNSYKPRNAGPPVIHCSAGVGRTGTYITIEAMRQQAKRDGTIDVYDFVSKMRQKRMKMVQTSAQYRFIFDTLVEYIHCGDTSITRVDFNAELKKLRSKDTKSGQTGLAKQFRALEKVTVWLPEEKYTGGFNPSNRLKNRFEDILPLDRSRPYLMTEVDGTSTNYINAAYINGCRVKDQFLVTQTPLPETVADIWRMVYDHKSNIIVMLNSLTNKDPSTITYWPEIGSTANFGPIAVTGTEEDTKSLPGITVRTFRITNPREKGNRTVRQFALGNWPAGKDTPSSPDSVLRLIQSLKEYYKPETRQRITVHCIDGVGASCAFCTIMSVIDQLEYNQTIDIFHAVRRLRLVRPQAVRNLAQYTFCYKAIQAHLISSASVYENLHQQTQKAEDDAQIYANVGADNNTKDEGQIYANVNV